jgi:GT2 family glycosyltransferase
LEGSQAGSDWPLVSILIVTYEPEPTLLRQCVASVIGSSYRPLQLVVVDNGSRHHDAQALVERELGAAGGAGLEVAFSKQETNLGYAGATNVGIQLSRGELVLLLNPDARVETSTVHLLVEAARRLPAAAGLAPKVLLADPGVVIDSVGLSLHADGSATQRGLGQADIGQYDLEEPVGGLCFAAALVRREMFTPTRVGQLDDRYFMFYEDVDWSLRAQVLGERFWSVPTARVFHFHSATTRHLGGGFKARLVQRNLIWTAVKNLESRSAIRVLVRRSAANLERVLALRQATASARAIVEAWAGLPAMVRSRRGVQCRRRRPDKEFLSRHLERSFFDVDTYSPEPSVAALVSVMSRLFAVAPDPQLERALLRIRSAADSGFGRDPARMAELVRESGIALGPGFEWLLGAMEAARD